MVELTGDALSLEDLALLSRDGSTARFSQKGRQVIAETRAIIDTAIAEGRAMYGVTTGLGSRATEALPASDLAAFSLETIRGRAHAAGHPLPRPVVRAAMAVRLNTMLRGAAGVSMPIADHLLAVFNAGLTPVVGEQGSIGAADLLLGASMAQAILGMGGKLEPSKGDPMAAQAALAAQGLQPPDLGPRDGLALSNHACFSAGYSALALQDAVQAMDRAIQICALSMLGFQANPSPLAPSVLSLKPHPCDSVVAGHLRDLLDGASYEPRRLQDPISLRNAVHVLGCAAQALESGKSVAQIEINAASDNPAVLPEAGMVLSTGNYFTPHLTQACEAVSRAFVQMAGFSSARIVKLCTQRLSGLPQYLADPDVGTNGFAPLLKLSESLLAAIVHRAQPGPLLPSMNADGIEDGAAHTMLAADALAEVTGHLCSLLALEAIVAAQACDMRGTKPTLGLQPLYDTIRTHSAPLRESRPLGGEIDGLAKALL